MISVVIPFRNDWNELPEVIDHLFLTATGDIEIIVVNDGSFDPTGRFKPIEVDREGMVVINNPVSRGVGYSFDRGVEAATGDIVVLQGCDVFPKQGWYDCVAEAVQSNPNSIGCATCIGLSEKNHDLYDPKNLKRYGASMLITMDVNDLPLTSDLRVKKPNYRDIFKGRWCDGKKSDEPYEISCLMGAMYFTTKKFYQGIGGFDTLPGVRYRGHRAWGHLEAYLSLKTWLSGGSLILYSDIEAGHVFGRKDKKHRYAKGVRSEIDMWWNALFMADTTVLDAGQRSHVLNYPLQELNLNRAKQLIKRNYSEVLAVREANSKRFTRDLTWFMEKFGIPLKG